METLLDNQKNLFDWPPQTCEYGFNQKDQYNRFLAELVTTNKHLKSQYSKLKVKSHNIHTIATLEHKRFLYSTRTAKLFNDYLTQICFLLNKRHRNTE